ncbi:PaaI family thioesterase [Breoghania sp. L-A4]|uniref:PaaI family thioesterase n=1 Tax=Breoghania sp. L-A4 TaxID=2304600 RepID=UPI000E35C162|nr:PaaI family thioesterase [Breoghania sp. L-A4]AXS39555.1 PaaI family thioesterase [Breoghania sp. L-A4]
MDGASERTYGVVSPGDAAGKTGLEVLQGIIDARLPAPPIARTLSFALREAEHGRAVFAGTPTFDSYNPLGTVHGGWTATLLDSALACAVHSTLAAGEGYTTMEFKVNCVRPITEATGELVCEGRIIHRGRRMATSEASLRDADGTLYAHGTETCMIFPAP